MWTLVFINMILNANSGYKEPVVEAWYEYESMRECFLARDQLLIELGSFSGYFPINTQAVCIETNE